MKWVILISLLVSPALILGISTPLRAEMSERYTPDQATPTPSETPLPSPTPTPSAETKPLGKIIKINYPDLNSVHTDVVADIATLKVGDTLTRQKLESSINDLRKWGIFATVEVLVEYNDDGIILNYDLVEGYIIKSVTIRGHYPILESKVRRALFLNPGIMYDHTKLPEQIDRLDRLYEKNGYFGTTILAVEDYNEENHQVTLYFRIKKGTTYRLRDTEVVGNTALYEKRIRTIIFTYSHYKPKQIKKDLQKIKGLYSKKGFVRARVRLEGETYDYDARKVDLGVLIRQGPRVKVAFAGNDHFMNKTLRKHITVFEDGDFDEFELDASKRKLINFYKQRGYEKVEVEWSREKINKDYYLVTFKIQEGPRRQISAIDFVGNNSYPSKELRSMMASKVTGIGEKGYYLQALFEQDLHTIELFYHGQGFLGMEVKSWEKTYSPLGDRVHLTVDINEGPRSMVSKLNIKGVNSEIGEEIENLLLLRPGNYYSPNRVKDDIPTILVVLANHGYPYSEVGHKVIEGPQNEYQVSFDINKGKRVKIGRLLFVGNALTKEKIIRQNLRIKEGDQFSALNILQSQINLRGLGIFDAVAIETLGLTSKKKKVNIVVRVQEKKTKIYDAEVGYNTDIGIFGKLNFTKLNIWGSGKNFSTRVWVGQQINRIQLNYIDPRVFGKGLALTLGTYAGIEDRPFFNNKQVGGFGSLLKTFGRSLSAFGRLEFAYSNTDTSKTVFNKINPRQDPDTRTRLVTTLGTTYDTRDNFGDPRSGLYLNGSVALTNQFIQVGGNYATIRANIGHWYSPMRRITIANALRVADILPFPSNTIVPADQRLYLGGDTTVRGFKQDSLLPSGGNFSLVYNLELQIRVFKNIMLAGFLDTGVVTNGITEVNLSTLRHSAGPSIRYITPVGPIRLDWGFVLDPKPGDATTNRVHIAFGYFF